MDVIGERASRRTIGTEDAGIEGDGAATEGGVVPGTQSPGLQGRAARVGIGTGQRQLASADLDDFT